MGRAIWEIPAKTDPPGATGGPGRNCRGGNWISQMPRLAARAFYRPEGTTTCFGFRVICTTIGEK